MPTIEETTIVLHLDEIVSAAVDDAMSDHDIDDINDDAYLALIDAAHTVASAAITGASLEMDRALRGGNPPSAGHRASAAFVRGAAYAGAVLHLTR